MKKQYPDKITKQGILDYYKEKYADNREALINSLKFFDNASPRTWSLYIGSFERLRVFYENVHESHNMTDWRSEVRAPVGTARFYNVRNCSKCGVEQSIHPAGRFKDYKLEEVCGRVL